MLSRTPGKSPAAARRAARTPLVAVDANSNINNFLHDDDDGPTTTSSSKKTPFKSSIAEKKRGVEKFTAVKSSTKKKRRSKSKIRRNDINNCDVCTTSCSPSPFVNNNNCSVPIIIAPADETHLNSFTIPIHESFHIYESDGEETFDFVANENIELETQTEENASSAVVVVAPIKPSTPRILFSAQQWEHKQCYTFASWLNKLFYPEGEEGGDAVNTISDEEINAEWSNANELFNSTYMQSIRNAVEREVKEGRLAIVPPRTERFVLDEVHVQEQLTKLLLSYTPRWLQLGLGIVLALNNTDGHNIKMNQCMTKESLKKIIKERVLTEPNAVRKYTGGKCKVPSGKFESNLRITIHQHALSQIMILIFFLDTAKMHRLLTNNPCLFESSSTMKSSEELLLSLCQDCFLKPGSIMKHLDFEGISVSHIQTPFDEYDFHVKNLAVDLKDGVRLSRMIDAVTSYRSSNLLSLMRLPASTRQHRVYNVDLALSALKHLGVPHISDITTAHIVAAHQPRILQLIWSIILYFDIPQFKNEINEYKASRLIQGYARRYLGVRSYRTAHHGIIIFQSLCRGFQVRSAVRAMKDAILLIQRVWRGHHAKRMYEVKMRLIVTIQRICRHRHAIRVGASIAIQRIWRGYICKNDFACYMKDVIIVQSVSRRFIVMNHTAMLRRMHAASTDIQRLWRGYRERINFGCDLLDIIIVQSICRRFLAIIRSQAQSTARASAAIAIQRVWRGYNAMKFYGFDLLDIITAQSVCRRFIAQRKLTRFRASRKIQSFVRMRIAMRKYSTYRRAIFTIQTHTRRLIASNYARDRITNIIDLQRVCRGWLCRKQCLIKVAQVLICRETSPTLPHSIQVDADGAAAVDGIKSSCIERDMLGSSAILNCSSSSDDGEEIDFTSRHAPKKQRVRVVKIEEPSPSSPHVTKVDDGDDDVSFVKVRESPPSLSCSSSDDGEEVYFTSRHAPKAQRFRVAKIVDSICDESKHRAADVHLQNYSNDNDLRMHSSKESDVMPKNDTLHDPSSGDDSSVLLRKQNAALVLIQAGWRRAIASKTLLRKRRTKRWTTNASEVAERAFLLLKHEVAAVLIQSMWRQVIASRAMLRKRMASIVCQRYLRKWAAGRKVGHMRLQATKDKMHRNILYAATIIQRSQSIAAIRIQKIWRGCKAKDKFTLILLSVVQIQSFARRYIASTQYRLMKAKHNASIVIQTVARGLLSRLEKRRVYSALTMLQRAARVMIYRRVECFAATEIQRVWRGYVENLNFIIIVISAIKIQALFRCHQARHRVDVIRTHHRTEVNRYAATEIQRYWRGNGSHIEFSLSIVSAIKIQAAVRGWQAKREMFIRQKCCRAIQTNWRGFLAKQCTRRVIAEAELQLAVARVAIARKEKEFSAATAIQRMWRGYQANVNFMLAVMSAIKIQSFTRDVLAKVNDGRSRNENSAAAENEPILRVMIDRRSQGDTGLRLEIEIESESCRRNTSLKCKKTESTGYPLGGFDESELLCTRETLPKVITVCVSSKSCRSSSCLPQKSTFAIRSPEFGKRTEDAMRTVLGSKSFNDILNAVADMEEITQQSFNDCQFLLSKGIDKRLITILRRCNRSSPHLELVRAILSVLTNLAQHPTILSSMAKEKTVDALSDAVHMFRDKTAMFALSSSLLEKMLLVNNLLVSKYSTPENRKRLHSIIFLCQERVSELEDMQKAMNCLENIVRLVSPNNIL